MTQDYSVAHLGRFTRLKGPSDAMPRRMPRDEYFYELFRDAPCSAMVVDYASLQYLYASENIHPLTGYSSDEWIDQGLSLMLCIVHPADVERLRQIHDEMFGFHFAQPAEVRMEFRYSADFRIIRKDGTIAWIMTQDSFIELDAEGSPLAGLQYWSEVTHLKRNNVMSLSISSIDPKKSHKKQTRVFNPPAPSPFTNREAQVLDLLAKGMSSKEIAGRMAISDLTVFKHRRNMIGKAGAANTQGLISYALTNGII